MSDFSVANHGSVTILTPLNESAKQWVADNLPDDLMYWGRDGIVIDSNLFPPIGRALIEEGYAL